MKKIQIIKNNDERVSKTPLINIITRTAARPNYFQQNYDSIINQSYNNIKHWVIYDDKKTYNNYLKFYDDIELVEINKEEIIKKDNIKNPNTGPLFVYNLYFNEVITRIKEGWILILDDDDSLAHVNVIKNMVNLIKYNTDMLIFQMKYLNGMVLPSERHFYKKPVLGGIGSPCVLVHHKTAKSHKWDGWKCADFRYIDKCWKNSSRKIWIKEPMISIGSINGNLGKKNDIKVNQKNKKEKIDFFIGIPTYNRKKLLENLLSQIDNEKFEGKYKIVVVDDNSACHEENKANVLGIKNAEIYKNKTNNGKFKYWDTFNQMLNYSKKYDFNHFIQIDDDFLLCEDFLQHMKYLSRKNPKKFIKYIRDKSSDTGKRWGLNKWVDGGTMIPYSFLQTINFKIHEIPISRWKINPDLSSGVWHQISLKLNKYGYDVIHTDISYAKHLGFKESKMNERLRKKININTINFKDDE